MHRRILLISWLVLSIIGATLPARADQTTQGHDGPKATQNWYDNIIFKDNSFTFEFFRTLEPASSGGADIGECFATARGIQEGDDESWYAEWLKTANRVHAAAQKSEQEGRVVSAREAYFRASNYFRTAGFYMHSEENRAKALKSWQQSKESFLKAISSLPFTGPIQIPYEYMTLPGYYLKASSSSGKKPLLIVHSGFDGTGEELYFAIGLAAVKRGYNCLIFEGPGQGQVIREENLPFRYDWEKVVTSVIDYALFKSDVDQSKIALMGLSMGGYLAPRAAAFDPRIKACIANGGVFDLSESISKKIPPDTLKLLRTAPKEFNREIYQAMKQSTEMRWFFNNGMWTFHARSPADLMKKVKKYTLKDIVKKIKCQMLVVDSEDDIFMKGQAKKLYEALTCPKEYLLFTKAQTAQAHCQVGARAVSNEAIFNWLDKVFSETSNKGKP